ncbi:MAG: fructosamine kinase family protein [Magnetovibrio sp.]|nr:fructosamine kinase family protein [Magnetovibrio sp.]
MQAVAATIERLTGFRPNQVIRLSGGCVGDVYQVSFPDGRVWVAKIGAPGSGLTIESDMLTYLAQYSDLPVPKVHFADESLLLMDRLENRGDLDAAAQRHGATMLADLHSLTTSNGFGFAHATVIGGLHQPNAWTVSWIDFFRDQRLLYMSGEAERAGQLPTSLRIRIENFAAHLDRWLTEPDQPALLHGDLWTGNILCANGRITGFIDPAIYYGDPEIELAFSTLFDTFGASFFDRYQDLHPLNPGFFEERRALYNIYPLLVHVRLFGGAYVQSVERTLQRFGY